MTSANNRDKSSMLETMCPNDTLNSFALTLIQTTTLRTNIVLLWMLAYLEPTL